MFAQLRRLEARLAGLGFRGGVHREGDSTKLLEFGEVTSLDTVGLAFLGSDRLLVADRSSVDVHRLPDGERVARLVAWPEVLAASGGVWAVGSASKVAVHTPDGVREIPANRPSKIALGESGELLAIADVDALRVLREGEGEVARLSRREMGGSGTTFPVQGLAISGGSVRVALCDHRIVRWSAEGGFRTEGSLSGGREPAAAYTARTTFTPHGPLRVDAFSGWVDVFDEGSDAPRATLELFGEKTRMRRIAPERGLLEAWTSDGQNGHVSAQLWDMAAMRPVALLLDRGPLNARVQIERGTGRITVATGREAPRVFAPSDGALVAGDSPASTPRVPKAPPAE